MRTLQEKIEAGDTELQIAYNLAVDMKKSAEEKIELRKHEIEKLEDMLLHAKGTIEHCIRRANEQGFDESIFEY